MNMCSKYSIYLMYLQISDIFDCTVVYDYEAQQEDELTITPGDTIHVLQKIDADWWEGNLNGRIGIFPANYVEEN